MKKTFLFIPYFLLLCACSVSPEFKTPTVSSPKSYTSEKNLVNTEQCIALGKQLEGEWWSLFACKPLNRVIHQAIAENYDITAAKKTLAEAEEAIRAARGDVWPQLSLDGTVGNQKYGAALFGHAPFNIPSFSYYELGPNFIWVLDLFGSTRYRIKQQRALAGYQAHKLEALYLVLTSNVVEQALEIASLNAEIAATQHIITQDENTLKLMETMFKTGAATQAEVLNAEASLENDRALLPPLKHRLNVASHALAILVGENPAEWAPPRFNLRNFTLPKQLPVSLPSELARKRPDILAAEANLHAASAAVGIATANLYPKLIINFNTFQEALSPQRLFNGSSHTWSAAAGLTAPLFNGGALTAEKRKAQRAYEAALAHYQQTILVGFQQVADALTALKKDANSVRIAKEAVRIANTSLKLAQKSYEVGTSGLLQIQEAQRQLARAQIKLITAQKQRYLDTAQLFVRLGGSPLPATYKNNPSSTSNQLDTPPAFP